MNVLNQNGTLLKKTLPSPNSDFAKTTLRGLQNFKIALPLLLVLEMPLAIHLSICHMQ